MRGYHLVTVAACVAVMVAGCGGAVASPSTPNASMAPASIVPALTAPAPIGTPTLAPTPNVSITELGQAYVACTDTANAQGVDINVQLDRLGSNVTAATLAAWTTLAGKFADNEAAFAACIRGIPWIPQFQSDAGALLEVETTLEAAYRQQAGATTPAQFTTNLSQVRAAQQAGAARSARIRADLGLPPPPTDSPASPASPAPPPATDSPTSDATLLAKMLHNLSGSPADSEIPFVQPANHRDVAVYEGVLIVGTVYPDTAARLCQMVAGMTNDADTGRPLGITRILITYEGRTVVAACLPDATS